MVGVGDIVQVNGKGEKLKVEELHYMQIPAVDDQHRTVIAQCLRPNAKTGEYDDRNRFENHVANTLTKVASAKPVKSDKPAGKLAEIEDGD